MASLAELRALVADVVRRDNRSRLYECSDHPGEYITVDWDLPSNDKGKIGYPTSREQIKRLFSPYQYLGDAEVNAQPVKHSEIAVLVSLARGTHELFRKPKTFK